MAFSRSSLFLERFWLEFRISLKSHKPVRKTYRPKKDNFCRLMTLRFPFLIYYTSNAFIDVAEVPFSLEKCLKMCLKQNRSVKRRDMGLVWELSAPGYGLLPSIINHRSGVPLPPGHTLPLLPSYVVWTSCVSEYQHKSDHISQTREQNIIDNYKNAR